MTPERYEQIGRLYQAALESAPALRADFIAEACGTDESLRGEVEALLAAHAEAEHFMEEPPDDVAAGWQVAVVPLVQHSFAHYQMRALLGKGGMGEVWLAEDTQLGRQIAVKLLPAEFTTNPERVRRFAQEARTASALNHPNIITIHEIGKTPAEAGDTHYIVTEYVEGETLRQHLTNLPEPRLQPAAAVEIATQIAAALAAAHQAGIVHRDIKPENVMLRRDGIVKVLDFGLAKLTEPAAVDPLAATVAGGSTDSGLVLGTPRYMSPEQARGERVDARTDIFSLGVLLYEMVTGRPPFAGATMSEVIAAILRDEPPPLAEAAPNTPPKLAHIISQALRKDRTERYQGTKDLLDELQQLKEQLLLERLASTPTSARRRTLPSAEGAMNKRRRAVLTTLAGIVVVSAVLAAWVYFKRAPGLTSKDTILLADFENRTGEAIFDQMLKQGLAIQLQQSPFLHLLPEAQVRHELKLMKRAPNERVTAELAREICERQNLKALIAGSLAPLGSHYVITLEALNGQTGETLAREQVEATNKEQVLRALSQAATHLREQLGESLSSIQRFDRPLQEGTTSKPEAFKAYSQGTELAVSGRLVEAILFLQRAVELDPEFAHAYSQMAIMYWATDQPGLATGYAKKSYELKERAGELEKFRITHKYHQIATGDLNKASEVLRLQRRTYPREWTGPNDLAVVHYLLGQSEQAVAEARESIRLNPNFSAPYRWLAIALLHLNRFAEAKEVLAQAIQQGLDHRDVHLFLYQLAFINDDTAGMQQQLNWAHGKPDGYVALDWQAQAAAFRGQWRQAQDFSQRALDLAVRGDAQEIAARYATEQALRNALSGACQPAKAAVAQGLKLARGRASLPRAALALALCGEANQVRSLVEELGKLYPEDTLINELWLPSIRAASLLQGNAAQALQHLQTAARYEAAAEFWPQYLRGQAYLKLKQGAAAAAEFQKILDHRGYALLSPLYLLAQSGQARATALTPPP